VVNKFLLALTCTLLASVACGDDGWVTGVGGTIELMDEHPNIAMVAEHVNARVFVSEGKAEVECLFILTNHGAADTVRVGFPEFYSGATEAVPFEQFRSFVDGEEFSCVRTAGHAGSGGAIEHWWVKDVVFGAGETRIVRDAYRAPVGGAIGDSLGAYDQFEYTLHTGASWRGPIEAATVTVTFEPCASAWAPAWLNSAPTYVQECSYTWHFRNFEPGRTGPPYIGILWRQQTP
jgi:hypothetical protein